MNNNTNDIDLLKFNWNFGAVSWILIALMAYKSWSCYPLEGYIKRNWNGKQTKMVLAKSFCTILKKKINIKLSYIFFHTVVNMSERRKMFNGGIFSHFGKIQYFLTKNCHFTGRRIQNIVYMFCSIGEFIEMKLISK